MYHNGIHAYRKTNVITADPGRLVLMCYEGAIDQLKIAKIKYMEKEFEGKFKALTKAIDLINELLCALDFEKGGTLARNLQALYKYMTRRIVQADTNRDIDAFDEVIGILTELLSAWKEIIIGQKNKVQMEAIGTRPARTKQSFYHIPV